MTSDRLDELETLLLDWEDGGLDDGGLEKLRAILHSNEESRSYFVRRQMISAAMRLDAEAGIDSADLMPSSSDSDDTQSSLLSASVRDDSRLARLRDRHFVRWVLAVAALVICLLGGRIVQLELSNTADARRTVVEETSDRPEAMSRGVAVVTRLVDVAWGPDQTALDVGDALSPGPLRLESGYAQIEFFCGATVIVEGPAELELKSPLMASVRRGRLRTQVPPAARGFSLQVDDMTVVDLGTEFGLSVSESGADVHVFDGEVELQQETDDKRRLTAGEGLSRAADGAYTATRIAPDEFVDISALERRAENQRGERFTRWQQWSNSIRSDERLIAYYAFDNDGAWDRRLSSSLLPQNSELDGAIVGANRVAGRWPAKSALEFKQPGDRVCVQVPGEFGSLTFSAWTKIDSLDRQFNSLFLTDNYNKGEPHWQILDSGQMYFSVRPNAQGSGGPRDFKALSPPFWQPSLSGRWLHLAVVYNVDEKSITHFLNGDVLSRHVVPPEQVVSTRIGIATIGNWSSPTMPDASFAIRNLNGSIDEFAVFSAALSVDEIQDIYKRGKP